MKSETHSKQGSWLITGLICAWSALTVLMLLGWLVGIWNNWGLWLLLIWGLATLGFGGLTWWGLKREDQ